MYTIIASLTNFLLIAVIYLFILRIAKLIYQDIGSLSTQEKKKTIGPHLTRLSGLGGKTKKSADIYPLTQLITIIGRAPTCTFILADQHISSQHIQIETLLGKYILTDLNSANGTLINNTPLVDAHTLCDGDTIILGQTILVFNQGAQVHV